MTSLLIALLLSLGFISTEEAESGSSEEIYQEIYETNPEIFRTIESDVM